MRYTTPIMHFILISLLFIAYTSPVFATTDTLMVNKNTEIYPIYEHLYWLQTHEELNADTAYKMFQNGEGKLLSPYQSINEGFNQNFYWLYFTICNISSEDKDFYYEFNNPFLNNIEVYKLNGDSFEKQYTMGSVLPFATRPYSYYDFVFPLHLQSNASNTYLIMAEKRSEIFSTKPELMTEKYFKQREQRLYIIFGVIMGIMVFNIIINIFLGISLKDKIHFLYSCYVLAALFWLFSSMGADFQFIFPKRPDLFIISQSITGTTTMILLTQLSIVFLKLNESKTRAKSLLNISKWTLIIFFILRITVYLMVGKNDTIRLIINNIFILSIVGVAIGMVWAAVVRIRQSFKPAWFYLAAIAYLALSIARTCIIIIGTRDVSELVTPPTSIQQGIVIETIIIFAGIIYRYNLFKKEREELHQKLTVQQLEMTQEIINAQEDERKRLAQDLHDDVGATLSSLLLHVTHLPEVLVAQNNIVEKHFEKSTIITQKALTDLRNISHDLLPKEFETLGMYQILKNRINELNTSSTIQFVLHTDGDDRNLSDILAVNTYRIVNELIHNIIKHSQATVAHIDINISRDNVMTMIEDNGVGFADKQASFGIGMKNINSRVAFLNGTINIDTNPQGTTVIIDIPI